MIFRICNISILYCSIFLYYSNLFKVMNNISFYQKTLVVAIFILAAAIITYVGYAEVFAQPSSSGNQSSASSSGNQSSASKAAGPLTPYSPGPHSNPSINTPFNQSKIFPNGTETVKTFNQLNGNNSQFFTKNKPVSNPNNNVGNSLAKNYYQNH